MAPWCHSKDFELTQKENHCEMNYFVFQVVRVNDYSVKGSQNPETKSEWCYYYFYNLNFTFSSLWCVKMGYIRAYWLEMVYWYDENWYGRPTTQAGGERFLWKCIQISGEDIIQATAKQSYT